VSLQHLEIAHRFHCPCRCNTFATDVPPLTSLHHHLSSAHSLAHFRSKDNGCAPCVDKSGTSRSDSVATARPMSAQHVTRTHTDWHSDYGHHVNAGRAGYHHLLSAPHRSVVWRRTPHVQKLARFTPTMQPMFHPPALLGEWAALQLYTAHTAHISPPTVHPITISSDSSIFLNYLIPPSSSFRVV
jgi:hypothetical protein